ncbi:hypothetical protein PIB30_031754 [Stylosanthes scabra]|uniref:Transposase MuDR plant domain-containing protein n=1 Tax=Stylosanthes scabra TaxID=79078 RepID=A0ABU6VD89_9FABA|nr:hypothetical protein [Stylosanthes scabra]
MLGAFGSRNQRETYVYQAASPSFDVNLQAESATGDSSSFWELGVAMVATPQPVSPQAFEGVPDPDPHVGEALRPDDSDEKPEFIEGDSDDDDGPVSQGSNIPAEFQVGQSFQSKEEVVFTVKNYNIHREVEYRVMESDHPKYLEKCKRFGEGLYLAHKAHLKKNEGFVGSAKVQWSTHMFGYGDFE